MKLNGLSMGVIGMAASAAVSLSSAPAQAQQAKTGSGQGATMHAQATLRPGSAVGDTGIWLFKTGDEDVKIETRDGKVIHATRNGKDIAVDHVTTANGGIKITDDTGKTVFEMAAPDPIKWDAQPLLPQLRAWRASSGSLPGGQTGLGAAGGGTWLWNGEAAEPPEPPKVMMGVTMAEPEYGLRKHCGLDQRAGTMVNEVYKDLPAAKAGIEAYDVIIEIDGKTPATPDVVRTVLHEKNAGDEVTLTVLHKCEPKRVSIKLEAYDPGKLEDARREQMKQAGIDPVDMFARAGGGPDEALIANGGRAGQLMLVPGANNPISADVQALLADAMRRAQESHAQAELLMDRIKGIDAGDDRARRLEDRLTRLEDMIQKLIDQKDPGSAKPATPRIKNGA